MAVAARKHNTQSANMPAARVYSQSAALLRAKREAEELERARRRAQRAAEMAAARRAALTRLSMMLTVGVAAAVMILVLLRYSMITEEYAGVNALRERIEQIQLEIQTLDVELNGAVSLQEAREAAEAQGMRYPTEDQIVSVSSAGQTIPLEAPEDAIEVLQ